MINKKIGIIFFIFFTLGLKSQISLEMAKITGDGNPTGNGPVQTTTINMVNNTDNPTGTTFVLYNSGNLNRQSVTYTIQNSQYPAYNPGNGIGTGNVMTFGMALAPTTIFGSLGSYGTAANNYFTSVNATAGQGINTVNNFAVKMLVLSPPLNGKSPGRYKLCELKFDFFRPVSNPIIHINGLGGTTASSVSTISTEFTLLSSNLSTLPTLTRLSGSSVNFAVSGANILNNNTTYASVGEHGSVQINGYGITTLTFEIYLNGKGSGTNWGTSATLTGDAITMGFSLDNICYKPVTGGTALNTNHGITALGRAGSNLATSTTGADPDNWPMVRKGAWTALESQTKGFVINRLTDAQILAIPAANLVEGMVVYNTTQNCLSLYTTAGGWKCTNFQSCPDN